MDLIKVSIELDNGELFECYTTHEERRKLMAAVEAERRFVDSKGTVIITRRIEGE